METERVYASLKSRFAAKLIDGLFFALLFFPTTYLVKGVWIMSPIDHRWAYGLFITDPLCITFLIVIALYFLLLEAYTGTTLGKYITRIHIIAINESPKTDSKPGLRRSLIRNALLIIDSLPTLFILGMILINKSPENARFGDEIAQTRVIKVPNS